MPEMRARPDVQTVANGEHNHDYTTRSFEGDAIGFRELGALVWRGRFVIIFAILLTTIAGAGYALTAKAWYRAEVQLIAADGKTTQGLSGALAQLGGLASLAGISVGGGGKAEPLAVLRSREFASSFIEDEHLLPILLAERWDSQAGRWKESGDKQPDIRDGVEFFDKTVRRVAEDKKTGLVTVTVEWTDPVLAAVWAERLVHRLNDQLRTRAISDADANISYLRSQLTGTNQVTLQQAISKLMETELEKAMIARGSEEFAFRVIDKPVVPKRRFWPKRTLIVLISGIFGAALGLVYLLVRAAISGRDERFVENVVSP